MKINNTNLLQSIWVQQLRQLSCSLLTSYTNGGVGLKKEGEYHRTQCLSMYSSARQCITDEIGKGQLLTRIRSLISQGHLLCDRPQSLFFSYRFDNDKTTEAFKMCHEYWIRQGVTVHHGNFKPVRISHRKELEHQLFKMLISHFPRYK